jgi:hypothetical protein
MSPAQRALVLSLGLSLAACASPERQLRTGLVDAGLPPGLSACMAHDMTPRLSPTQLMRLRSLSRVGDLDPMTTSVDRFLYQVRALRDPEILMVTSKAAARCALGL